MNPAADPAFVAAEVAYRFERDRIIHPPVRSARHRAHRFTSWWRRPAHRSRGTAHGHTRSRHA